MFLIIFIIIVEVILVYIAIVNNWDWTNFLLANFAVYLGPTLILWNIKIMSSYPLSITNTLNDKNSDILFVHVNNLTKTPRIFYILLPALAFLSIPFISRYTDSNSLWGFFIILGTVLILPSVIIFLTGPRNKDICIYNKKTKCFTFPNKNKVAICKNEINKAWITSVPYSNNLPRLHILSHTIETTILESPHLKSKKAMQNFIKKENI